MDKDLSRRMPEKSLEEICPRRKVMKFLHEVFPWKSKIKKEEGQYAEYIWICHNLVEEVIVGAIKRY